MNEEKTPGTAVAVREQPIARSEVAIWDASDFQQMKRVGIVLAQSGLVPESLCTGKVIDPTTGKETIGYLGDDVVGARCTLICNQARLWGADPLNVLQCTSLINGRLMYEGKLVNAVVQHLTGVKLRFELGVWETDHIEIPEDKSGLNGIGERLAIRCFDPEDPAREVSGSVGMWKTTRTGSPWSAVGNWPRQLRYRAAREWARAYEPGAILGILADGDQEIETLDTAPRTSGVMARLAGKQEGPGFDHEEITRVAEAQVEPTIDAILDGDEIPSHEERPTETVSAPTAETEPDTLETVTDASTDGPEETSGPSDTESKSLVGTVVEEGHPEPGEVYLHAEMSLTNADGRRVTFKDGTRYSTVTESGAAKYKTYAEHAPEPEETAQVEDMAPAVRDYAATVQAAKTFAEAKVALVTLQKTEWWTNATEDDHNEVRFNTWAILTEAKVADLPEPFKDVSAYRLWLEYAEDVDLIESTLSALEDDEAFKSKPDALKENIRGATAARINSLSDE